MSDVSTNWSLLTRLIHEGERAPAPSAPPSSTPIYTASTYVYRSAEAWEAAIAGGQDPVYGRNGNPTVGALEQVMVIAEGGVGALACASGMAAMHAAILAAGTPRGASYPQVRSILAARDIYGVTTVLLQKFFAAQGVPVNFCDMCDLDAVDAAIAEYQPDILIVEQISNPLLRIVDIEGLARCARAAGARLIVDNTITTPIVQRPLTLGADLVVHSATKYLGGHGDVTGGIVVARARLPYETARSYLKVLGGVLGPFEAQQILRGIKTLSLRVRQQCANAAAVAAWLQQQPQVAQVYYPGLVSHPQYHLATSALGGMYGAMVSFELRAEGRETLYRFINALRLILPATSLGDVYTLLSVPVMSSHRDLTPEQRAERGIAENLVRLSIGIEDAADVIADLQGALATVGE